MGQVALGENNAYYALFLIYEVLLLKILSANRQFCDTGLLFFSCVSLKVSHCPGAEG